MIRNEFELHSPKSLDDALQLLAKLGDEAEVLAGGMSLVPMMALGLAQPDTVVSLNRIRGCDGIRDDGDAIVIEALARHCALEESELLRRELPAVVEAASHVGDVQVRNRGTVGGSVAHADPAANYPPLLLALDAEIVLQSARSDRRVAASDFFRGLLDTDRAHDELVTAVRIPKLPATSACAYTEFIRVEGNFAIVNAAAVVEADGSGRVALGGVGPVPVLVTYEDADAGEGIVDAVRATAEDAFDDLNGNARYKREMAVVLAHRAIARAQTRLEVTS